MTNIVKDCPSCGSDHSFEFISIVAIDEIGESEVCCPVNNETVTIIKVNGVYVFKR